MSIINKLRQVLKSLTFRKEFDIATFGEKAARDELIHKGYFIRETNWRFHKYEIDIIAHKENVLAFIEVKTRSSVKFGRPHEAVTRKKRAHIIASAKAYIASKKNSLEDYVYRFDIVEVLVSEYLVKRHSGELGKEEVKRPEKLMEINHIENAFQARF